MLDDLVKTALIGTARATASFDAPTGAVGDALAKLPTTGAESRLLDAVAVLSRYEVCGRVPVPMNVVPAAALADARPACSHRAGELLVRVLATDAKSRRTLLDEWLAYAGRAGQRVPPALIPTLLDQAVGDVTVRDAVAASVGARGAWLMAMNPRWRLGLAEQDDPVAIWTTGTPTQRAAAVRRMRATDPLRAVELIRSTWAEDGADERAAFVEGLAIGLTDADEPFLEPALDDRSKQVRTAAAELLARLPGSAFVRRMTERATALLSFTPAVAGGLLRKGKPAAISVALPTAFDPSWERDGVAEKGSAGLGPKQWWLRQIVAAIPPGHWSTTWGIAPAPCLAALPPEFADVPLDAWDEAAGRSRDVAWVTALLSETARHGRRPPRVELLDVLPPASQQAVATEMLRATISDTAGLMRIIHRTRLAFGPQAAAALFDRIDHHARVAAGRYDYTVGQIMEAVALRVPPDAHDGLAERWSGPAWEPYRKPVDACLTTLQLRRDIQKEFAT
jgi:hypothetical protein